MNYGREGVKKKSRDIRAKSPKVIRKAKIWFYKLLLVAALALAVCLVFAGYGVYKGIIDSSPTIDAMDVTPTGFLTTILDTEGNTTATLVASGSNRVYVTIDEIPADLQHAFIAIEDARFYEHNGIDIKGIVRAGLKGILSGGHFSQGASTITQQLLKNNVFTSWTTDKGFAKVVRKLQEQYLAVQLEKKVNDKDWILENYLNTVNLGQNSLGVQAAARRYFDKDVSELTLSECAVIAGITKSPSGLNPISHPRANKKRWQEVLQKMEEQGYITKEQHEEALADNVYKRIKVVNTQKTEEGSQVNSYFDDAVTAQVIEDLMELKGYTQTEANKLVYNSGLTIYSTQDPKLQAICDEEINNAENYPFSPLVSFTYRLTIQKADGSYANYDERTMLSYYQAANSNYSINFSSQEAAQEAIEKYKSDIMEKGDTIVENGEYVNFTLQPQTALTLIDQTTGEVKAIVGGRGDKVGNRTLNRATDSTRQPGSTFKVLAAYAPAMDGANETLATVKDDAPYTYTNGTPLKNYDNHYRGFTNFRTAITHSINVVAVKTLTDIGIENGYTYLENLGFTTLSDRDKVQALALGGVTNGVTNLELTAAYATIANGGVYTKPRFYTKILDHDGNVLIDNTPQTKTVLKETTAWLLTDAMKDVITQGTGTSCNFEGMALAGKSGTTTKNRDALFAGFTPYYTCVVWGGYDDNTPQTLGTSYSKKIWRAVMSRVHADLEYKDFTKPGGIIQATVCKKSGKLAKEGLCDCDPRGSQVYTEYFAAGTEPTEYCDVHGSVTVCSVSGQVAGPYCPESDLVTKAFILGGSQGTDDAPYLVPTELTGGSCQVHTSASQPENPADDERTVIDGDTGLPSRDPADEPSDSHTGLDDEDQVLLDNEDFE